MLKKKIEEALNKQIAMEGYASLNYLAMASWCDRQSLDGCAQFLYRQSEEEKAHMLKLLHYVNDADGHAFVPAIKEPKNDFKSVQEVFELVYEHEQKVTHAINDIVALCYAEKDHATLHFMQWYVDEQREEESLMRTILDRMKLIGDGPQSLYYIDNELVSINKAALSADQEPAG